MKYLSALSLLVLLLLGSCFSTGGVPAVPPAQPPAPSEPAGFTKSAAFETYGIRLVSSTPQESVADAELVLETGQDVELIASLWDGVTKDFVSSGAEIIREGDAWRVIALFPKTGRYDLSVSAKPASDTGNTYYQVAVWSYDAVVPPADAVGMTRKARFSVYGLSVVSATPLDGVEELEVVLASDQDLDLYYQVVPAGQKSNSLTSAPAAGEHRWSLPIELTASGEYVVNLLGRTKAEGNVIYDLATWRVRSAVSTGNTRFARFAGYGLRVITEPAAVAGADTEMVLAADRDLRLAAKLVNRASRAETALPVIADGTRQWRIPVYFPATGSYEVSLTGRVSTDPGTTAHRLARWVVDATVPAGDITYGAFQRLGMRVVSSSPRTGVEEAEIVLASTQELTLSASLVDHATGEEEYPGPIAVRTTAGWRVIAPFSRSGAFDVLVSAVPANAAYGTAPERLARWSYAATVTPDAHRYVYERPDGFWRIRLSEIGDAPEGTAPAAWGGHAPATRGLLADELTLTFNTTTLRLPKGTPLLLDVWKTVISQFAYTTTSPVSFKVGDAQINAPKGSSWLFSWYGSVVLDLPGEATLALGRHNLKGAEQITLYEGPKEKYLVLSLAADTAITLAGATTTWPAGSDVYVDAPYQVISRILVYKDISIVAKGVTTPVPAYSAAMFDAQGNFTGTEEMGR